MNATTTCEYTADASGTIQSSACSTATDGFTHGELVMSVDLFLILMVMMVATYHLLFRRIKIKNQ